MRNHSFLLLVFLLVDGVFGVDTDGVKSVSVMAGDSLTLHNDLTEIQTDGELKWKIQEDTIIAEIDKETNTNSVPGNDEGSFKGRLKLDEKTGSLTITNIKTTDSRVYKLEISNKDSSPKKEFSVKVHGVFGVDTDGVKSVSVTKGDSVTLHTDFTEIQTDQILWKFGGNPIARLNNRWSNIELISQTGDLTISNIQNDQAGVYEVTINTGSVILDRKYRIASVGVFSNDGEKKISATEGKSVSLHTEILDIPEDNVIEWTFGPQDTVLVKTDRQEKIINYTKNGTFKDRLQLTPKSGDLEIKNIRTEDSGQYKLKIIKSTYTLERIFSVTLSGSRESLGPTGTGVSGMCGASVLVWAVAVFLLQEV